MGKAKAKRWLAIMLALAIVLGNFWGGGITAKAMAAIWSATASVSSLPSTGGSVDVTVKGEDLPETLYYRVRQQTPEGYWTTIVNATAVSGATATGLTFTVPISANTESTDQVLKIGVNENNSMYGWMDTGTITVKAAGAVTPTVDKTVLNNAIADAEALVESEYTAESWSAMQAALTNARTIAGKADATEAEVAQATKELTEAVSALVKASVVDASTIRIAVVDQSGKAVPNVKYDIYEVFGPYKTKITSVTSDAAGMIEYPVADLAYGAYDATYKVMIADSEPYTCSPDAITYGVNSDSEIETIDGVAFTGNENLQFVVTPKEVTPQGDKKVLNVKVVDKDGNAMPQFKLGFIDATFPNTENNRTSGDDGMVKIKITDSMPTTYTLKVHSSNQDKYQAEPIELTTNNKCEIITVNGQPYDGIQVFEFVVTEVGGEEEKAAITAITANPTELTNEGGVVTVSVLGTKLTFGAVKFQILDGETETAITPVLSSGALENMQEYSVNIPENTTTEAKTYTIKAAVDGSEEWKTATVTVAAKPVVIPDDKDGAVTGITVTPETVPATGGTVELAVTGTDLTADNWGVEVKAYVAGTDFERENLKAEVSNITASGATLTIPANTMVNDIEYRITAGAKKDGVVAEQAKATVTQAAKGEKSVIVYPKSVIQKDTYTVEAIFDENVTAAADEETLKKLIFIADNSNENSNRFDLSEAGTLTVEGNKVTLVYKEELALNATSRLYVNEGALRNSQGQLIATFKWTIDYNASISKVVLEKDIFDYKGGTVVANLKGLHANEIDLRRVEASVFMAEKTDVTDIPVTITAGTTGPVVTFDVPENETDRTQCYLLKVRVDGLPVYEGTGENPAEKAVVSVLPKGETDDTKQTLGGMTITGNNKDEADGEVKNVTVTALKGTEGALKVLLRLYGTNLDSTKTVVRAIDENGIIWPVYSHVPGCDGEWRFLATAGMNANGVVGDGNSQFIEVLPPKYAGTNKTYTIQVAIDGENFLEEPSVTLTVNNSELKGESSDYVECNPENYKYITVRHVEEGTGKELADADVYTGYYLTAVQQFVPEFAPKDIPGYTLVKSPEFASDVDWNWYFIEEGQEFTYEYRAVKVDDPDDNKPDDNKPSDNNKPSDSQDGNKKPSADKTDGNKNTSSEKSKSPKTGDPAMAWPFMLAAVSSLTVIGKMNRKKRDE